MSTQGAHLTPGERVSAGKKGTDEYDTGMIVSIDGARAMVAWDSGTRTNIELSDLQPTTERYSGGHRME